MTEQQIELQMRVFNERINETERTLEWLYEQRREFINRHNLNKPCSHKWDNGYMVCTECGYKRPVNHVDPNDDEWDKDRRPSDEE